MFLKMLDRRAILLVKLAPQNEYFCFQILWETKVFILETKKKKPRRAYFRGFIL
jgi:hypothetical protein